MRTICDQLRDRAAAHATRPAVIDAGGTSTWRELHDSALGAYDLLTVHGVRPGDRVVSFLPAGRAHAALLFATVLCGATFVPATDTTPYLARAILEDCTPAAVVAEPDVATRLGLQGSLSPTWSSRAGEMPATRGPGATAFLLYTSGSSGRPKAITCPDSAVEFVTAAIATRLGYTSQDRIWNRLPVTFDYGLYQLLLACHSGAAVIEPAGTIDARELVRIAEQDATIVPLTPSIAHALVRLAARRGAPNGVRLLTSTGEAFAPALAQQLRSVFPSGRVVAMYGMTECKRIAIADPDEDLVRPWSAGKALPGTLVRVVDERGRVVAAGVEGELQVIGPHVMSGYWGAPELSEAVFGTDAEGRPLLRTGDRGHMDAEGHVYVAGRGDGMFKYRGQRMSVSEVEAAMEDIPGVRRAVALVPGDDGRLRVWAEASCSVDAVLAGVAERLGTRRVPDECHVVDALPVNERGKVDRSLLRSTTATT